MARHEAPVFVVGCPRSGTTLVYDMLLSAGGFAVYLAESNVFNLLAPRFGDLGLRSNRERLIDAWLDSKLYRASFLNREEIREKVMDECQSAGDFMRIVMGEMARQQGVRRWADNSPEELLQMRRIKQQIPEALFVHVIRDGRDTALSLAARPSPWIRPFFWDEKHRVLVAGLLWQWMMKKGRAEGRQLGSDYIEIHFEELNAGPHQTLRRLGDFIAHDLNYNRILRSGIGTVVEPNTSFRGERNSPVGRWTKKMSSEQLALFEGLAGSTLKDLGYPLASTPRRKDWLAVARMRATYRAYLEAKFWFKNSALGRAYLGPMSGKNIDDTVIATDPARETVTAGNR